MKSSVTFLLSIFIPVITLANGTWVSYRSDDIPGLANVVTIATEEHGVFWCGTRSDEHGVFRFNGDSWQEITTDDGLPHNAVSSIEVAPDGDIWFGTVGGGVSRYDHETWTTYTVEDGLVTNSVTCIHIMPDGDVWCGTNGSGVMKFDGATWTSFDTGDGLCGNQIFVIDSSPNGDIWFGSLYDGASCFDGETWTTYKGNDGLLYDSVLALAVDHDGNVWFGVHDFRYKPAFINSGTPTAKSSGMYPGAVTMYDGDTWALYTYRDGLPSDWVEEIAVAPNGDLWFATVGEAGYGVSMYDGETMTIYTTDDGLAGNQVYTVHAGPDGKIYFGTMNGVSVYSPADPVEVTIDDKPSSSVTIIGNYPNPFNPFTDIVFSITDGGLVTAVIYNSLGQEVRTLFSGYRQAGIYRFIWNGEDNSGMSAASGHYYCSIRSEKHRAVKKMLLLR